jgi:glycosyltransferase involved in cell wall biosynthesis
MTERFKLLIWSPIPSHHQSEFFGALRSDGVDLVVHYFMAVPRDRLELGWDDPAALPAGERRVPARVASVRLCADWRERIHILPGYGHPFLLGLALFCSWRGLTWLHWSEPSDPNARWRRITNLVRRFYAALVNRYACGALAIGEMARQDFVRWGIRPNRIRLLPYSIAPVHTGAVAARNPGNGAGVRFLFLGVLKVRKAVDVLLTAFAQVVARYPNASLTLVGNDESGGAYQRLAESLGVFTQARFLGSVGAGTIGEILASHDVLVLPSRFDGWGMVLSEAASAGLALIATDRCGAAHHLIENGTAGYLVPAEDARSLADAMMQYCAAPETIARHGARSRELFAELVPARNSARLRAAVQDLCSSPRASGA